MKKLLTLLLAFPFVHGRAQITWSPAMTVASNTYSNLHPRVTLDKTGNPLILWGNSGSNKAYFSRWNGSAFTGPVMVNSMSTPVFAADWAGPDISSHGDTVYVVFKQTPETDTNNHMYIVKSTNGGLSFSAPVRIDNINDSVSRFPIVTTDDIGNPMVAFMKFNPGLSNARYVVSKSSDYGNTFSPDVLASSTTGDVCDCCPASVVSKGNTRVVLYRNNLSNIRTTWAGISANSGNSFTNMQVDGTNWMIMACPSTGPDGVIVGDTLYNTFMSQGSGSARVYGSKTSISAGTTTSSILTTGSITGLSQQNYPRIANSGNAAAIVWKQIVSGSGQVSIVFTNSITSGFPTVPDLVGTGTIANADVTMAPGVIHVVWQDDNTGTVMYRKGIYSTTSVEKILNNRSYLSIFPNPATTSFSISLKDMPKITHCFLMDNTGKRLDVPTSQSVTSIEVSVAELAEGTYYVLLSDSAGKKYYSKLIKQ